MEKIQIESSGQIIIFKKPMATTWYGKTPAKQLEQLLESKPKLFQLLVVPDFVQQLKSYNSKLLDYVTNNPALIGEAIELIVAPPSTVDSNDRKYKYPLQVVQMIEAETTCVLNSFFKQTAPGIHYFDTLFNILHQAEILPLLAGYFFRTNICLLNNRYKETLDRVYIKPHLLNQLINHADQMPICNTIQLYLNLDINKSPQSDPNRLEVKKQLIKKIIAKIQTERKIKRPDSGLIIENLMTVLIETIEKYYLILDGKALVDILTSQHCIETMLTLIKENWEGAYPAFNFFISLINYYSFSSFNADETDPEKKTKNLQRLEAQSMVIGLRYFFPIALDKIMKVPLLTLYEYKLLQVLCHCISISSQQILKTIKETKFFGCLITLLFKHEENNILHMLIEKSFLHVFISERKVYEQYKRHLFCEIDIIELTANRVLSQYEEGKIFEGLKKKKCFGHFMRILKIYSGIQTTEEAIINAIKSKTEVWNKISAHLIKPYEAISFKELGSYDGISQGKLQQFQVKRSSQPDANPLHSNPKPLTNSMIEQIRKQDEILPAIKKQLQTPKIVPETMKEELIQEKKKQEELLKAPTHNLTAEFKSDPPREIKKVESFKDFMTKKKVQAEQEIRLKRSLSHEKRLSGSKGKMIGPSPKKNSWTEKTDENGENSKGDGLTKMSSSGVMPVKTSDMPRIPHYVQNTSLNIPNNKETSHQSQSQQNQSMNSGYRSYYGSSIQQAKTQPSSSQDGNRSSVEDGKSEKNMELLKKIKVIRIDAPKQKRYRRMEEKDKVLLDFLGITTGAK